MRALLIEPDVVLARTYREALEDAGWQVNWAPSAQAALDMADQTLPDIVILEVQLAAHNGIEFLYEFRSYPEWSNIPVVIHSLVPPQEFANHNILYKELGVKGYYYKPNTRIIQLLAALREHVSVAS